MAHPRVSERVENSVFLRVGKLASLFPRFVCVQCAQQGLSVANISLVKVTDWTSGSVGLLLTLICCPVQFSFTFSVFSTKKQILATLLVRFTPLCHNDVFLESHSCINTLSIY
jgi:hypothetical protein